LDFEALNDALRAGVSAIGAPPSVVDVDSEEKEEEEEEEEEADDDESPAGLLDLRYCNKYC
jgi:hypothetical protein